MTLYDYQQLRPWQQEDYRWHVVDMVANQTIGFFRTMKAADAMAERQNSNLARDANGLLRYRALEVDDGI